MNSIDKSDTSGETKHLVVITSGGIYWLLWSLDYIERLINSGESVVVVDISAVNLKIGINRIFFWLNKFYRVNSGKNLISNLTHEYPIKIYRPKLKFTKTWKYKDLYLKNSIDFRNGLDAEYFEKIEKRVLQDSDLKRRYFNRAKNVFNFVYHEVSEVIENEKITNLVVSGGRTLIPAGCIAASKESGIDFSILESNERSGIGYFAYHGDFRTNCTPIQELIVEKWNDGDPSKLKIAQNYLDNKLFRQDLSGMNFAANFVDSELIDELKKTPYVAIFLTSSFEFLSFPGKTKLGDHNRLDQIEKVCMFSKIAKEYGFVPVVRAHPSRPGYEKVSGIDDPEWSNLCDEIGATYISSKSNMNSYEIMKNSNLNAVYVSSAGVDSLILGAQTLIVGNSEYANLVPELCAFDEEAIRSRFRSINQKIEIERIYPYAFHMATYGQVVSRASLNNEGKILYDGKQVEAPRFRFLSWLLKRP
jgi:hypothetical protein